MHAEPDPVTDEELARRSQAGSLASFETLVFRYEARIYGFVYQFCRSQTDARDLTQATFLAAFRGLDQFQPHRSFRAWLFAIARRKAVDHARGRRPPSFPEPPETPDPADPAWILGRREAEHDLWSAARRRLPTPQFAALWLRYQEDMDVKTIARAMGRTQAGVKVLLFRARQALSQALASQRAEWLRAITPPAAPEPATDPSLPTGTNAGYLVTPINQSEVGL